jgi:superfamily II RNA helicase
MYNSFCNWCLIRSLAFPLLISFNHPLFFNINNLHLHLTHFSTQQQAHESQTVSMKDDLKKMKRVLKRLGYTSTDGVLGTKGRFSCELSTPDELVLTDMVFDGVFNDLKIEQAVALVSCFVFKEGTLRLLKC